MAGRDKVAVKMTGGGPWGFRLYGGDDDPLVVAKLRRRSKAHNAGLQEGDVLKSINGYPCDGMSHGTAMGLLEQAGHSLSLEVARGGPAGQYVITPSSQALGSVYTQQQTQPAQLSQFHGNPYPRGPSPQSNVQHTEQTLQEGDTTKHITTDTKTERFGGTTLTKVTRQEVSHTGPVFSAAPHGTVHDVSHTGPVFSAAPHGKLHDVSHTRPVFSAAPHGNVHDISHPGMLFGAAPHGHVPEVQHPRPPVFSAAPHGVVHDTAPKPLFQVSNFSSTAAQKPAMWSPAGGNVRPTTSISAPKGVVVQQNPDRSVTMTLGFGGEDESKENMPPPPPPVPALKMAPAFKVAKVTTEAQKGVWSPHGASQPQFQAPAPAPAQPKYEPQQPAMWQPSKPPEPVERTQPVQIPIQHETDSDTDSPMFTYPESPTIMSIDINKLIKGESSDSNPDSPGYLRKKKIFADSSFYDDPNAKYPTIEEQIKMARKVALSLMAPENQRARGHKMFIKRQQRSEKWVAGKPDDKPFVENPEIYYNPNPWQPAHVWQPAELTQTPRWEPPKLTSMDALKPWTAPVLPTGVDKEEKSKALSAEEFERMRLYEQKTMHNVIAPQVCFSLAEDLRNMKGRGGKLFAKRREKSEQWVVDPIPKHAGPNPEFAAKLIAQAGMNAPPMQPRMRDQVDGMPVNRLSQMIDPPKAAMTPWEAAVDSAGGSVDAAFSHLHEYMAQKRRLKTGGHVYSNIQDAALWKQKSQPTTATFGMSTTPQSELQTQHRPAKLPWTAAAEPSSPPEMSPATGVGGASSSTVSSSKMDYSRKVQSWGGSADHGGAAASSGSSPFGAQPANGGFRPVKFLATGAAKFSPGGAPAASMWQPSPSRMDVSEGAGFCDL